MLARGAERQVVRGLHHFGVVRTQQNARGRALRLGSPHAAVAAQRQSLRDRIRTRQRAQSREKLFGDRVHRFGHAAAAKRSGPHARTARCVI